MISSQGRRVSDTKKFCTVVPLTYLPPSAPQKFTYSYDHLSRPPDWSIVRISFRSRYCLGLILPEKSSSISDVDKIKKIRELLPYRLTPWQRELGMLLQTRYGAVASLAWKTVVGDLLRRPTLFLSKKTTRQITTFKDKHTAIEQAFRGRADAQVVWTGRIPDPTQPEVIAYIKSRLTHGGQILCLVPEHSLVNFYASRYQKIFGDIVAIATSDTTRGRRSALWQEVITEQIRIIVGTRSAIYLPFTTLTDVIIVDAIAEGYKSWDQQPYEDVRVLVDLVGDSMSVRRLLLTVVPPLVGRRGKSALLVSQPKLASVTVLDRRKAKAESGEIPETLRAAIARVAQGELTLVVINRLGYGLITCRDCQKLMSCSECQQPIIRGAKQSLYCSLGHILTTKISLCPHCQSARLQTVGFGIEQAREILIKSFPEKKIITVHAKSKDQVRPSLTHADIIIATPAIATWLATMNRPALSILWHTEQLFAAPTWRATERALDLLWRLRLIATKNMIIESSLPDHPAIRAVCEGQFASILRTESEDRRRFAYPPFVAITVLRQRVGQNSDWTDTISLLTSRGATVTSGASKNRPALLVRWSAGFPNLEVWESLSREWIIDTDPLELPQ